jgi:hypothetical protein
MITRIRISLSWGGTLPHPILPAGVHSTAEIMPLVLAAHGLEMPEEFNLERPAAMDIPESLVLMILAIEVPRNRT